MLLFLAQKTKIVEVFFLGTNFMILVKMKISA